MSIVTTRFAAVFVCLCIVLPPGCAAGADLLDVYRSALTNDPQIREANNIRLAAGQAKPQALAALLPQVNGSGAVSREKDKGNQNTVETVQDISGGASFVESFPFNGQIATNKRQFGVDLRQSLFRWENWVELRRADARVAQAEADYQVSRQDLAFRVAQSYFNVLAAQDSVAARQAALASVDRQLASARGRFAAGLIGIAEVDQALAARDSAAAGVIQAKRELSSTALLLTEITSESFDTLKRPADSIELAGPNPDNLERWASMAMEQNPALLASRLAADVAQERVSSSYGGHLPSLDLLASRYKVTSDGIYTNADGSPFGSTTLDQYQNRIGIQFSIPIFSGGLVSSQVREAVYQHRAAKDRVERVTRQTQHDVSDAYQGVLSEIARVKALQQSLTSSARALRSTELSYDAGTRAALDVLESRRLWLQAKTDYLRSRYDYMIDLIKLQQAAGMLNDRALADLNAFMTDPPGIDESGPAPPAAVTP